MCLNAAMSSSTGGGRYAWFFRASTGLAFGALGELTVELLGVDRGVEVPVRVPRDKVEVDGVVRAEIIDDHEDEAPEDDSSDGDGGVGSSMPSRSPSMISLSSSVEGKKLRNNSSACHLDAFRNSTHTSIRPGRDSAGSRRSRWFVVLRQERWLDTRPGGTCKV